MFKAWRFPPPYVGETSAISAAFVADGSRSGSPPDSLQPLSSLRPVRSCDQGVLEVTRKLLGGVR